VSPRHRVLVGRDVAELEFVRRGRHRWVGSGVSPEKGGGGSCAARYKVYLILELRFHHFALTGLAPGMS
jgi:hypothetical protein